MTTISTVAAPPSARVVYESADLPAGTQTITVTRTADGVSEVVPGAQNAFASGGAVVDDPRMPTGVVVSYSAEAFDASGVSLGFVAAVTGAVFSDSDKAWVSDPTHPASVVQVVLKGDFVNTLTFTRQVQVYQVGDRTVALMGAVGKLQDLNISMQTDTITDGKLLQQILSQTAVLIRTNPPADVPRLLYVVVPQVSKTGTGSLNDIQYGGGSAVWQGTGQEISSTTLNVLAPLVTYQTYMTAFPTMYAGVMAVYTGTYLDAMKNPPGGA